MNTMCRISIDAKTGSINKSCGSAQQNQMLLVQSKPLYVSVQPQLTEASIRKKHQIVKYQLSTMQKCYEGKLKSGICRDPIDLIVFKYQHCPACDTHIPTIQNRIETMKQFGIPVKSRILDVKEDNAVELYQQSGCRGTPCVVMRDPSNPTKYIRIAEGIDQDIGFYSNVGGFENPLFVGLSNNNPKRIFTHEVKSVWR
jgi:hypothetical protein